MHQVLMSDIKKVRYRLYYVPGVTNELGQAIFIWLRDNRKTTKKDFGWVITEGTSSYEFVETSPAIHDRRSKALDELNQRLRRKTLFVGETTYDNTAPEGTVVTADDEVIIDAKPKATSDTTPAAAPTASIAKYNPPEVDGRWSVNKLVEVYNEAAASLGHDQIDKYKGTKKDLIVKIQTLSPIRGKRISRAA